MYVSFVFVPPGFISYFHFAEYMPFKGRSHAVLHLFICWFVSQFLLLLFCVFISVCLTTTIINDKKAIFDVKAFALLKMIMKQLRLNDRLSKIIFAVVRFFFRRVQIRYDSVVSHGLKPSTIQLN